MMDLLQVKAERGDRRFEALLLASASIVWWTNAAGEFVEEQPYWRDYTGQAWEEYRGARWVSCLHPDDRDTVIEDWKAAVSSGGPYFTQGRIWSARHGAYRAFQARGVAVRDEHGDVEEWLGALTDIQDTIDIKALLERTQTELANSLRSLRLREAESRKQLTDLRIVESELRLSETRYRLLVEQSVDGIFVASHDGRYLDANQVGCDMLGLSRADLLQATFRDVLIPEEHSRIEEEVANLADGSVHRSEWRFRRKDGTVFFGELAGRRCPEGTLVGVLRDVTERREHEDRVNALMRSLRESEERLQVLVGELQHRSRNLIGVVIALAEMTGRASKTIQDFNANFADRLRALSRAQGLLSRTPSSDSLTFDDLLVSELSAQTDWAEESGRVTINGPKGVMLRSDLAQTLAMALHELTTNAVKHGALGQKNGRLDICWRAEAGPNDQTTWIVVDWKESGVESSRLRTLCDKGNGRRLIEEALPYQFGARTTFAIESDGAHCIIALPVSGPLSAETKNGRFATS